MNEKTKSQKTLWFLSILWFLLVSFIAFLWNLGSIGLIDKTEPMFVEAARQMVITEDWVTPYWNGETRFDKPPLTYWLISLSFKLFGINEWGARIPSALAAIALVALGFYTLLYFGFPNPKVSPISQEEEIPLKPEKSWLSAGIGTAILALNPFWIAWGRTGVSDMFLSSAIAMSLLSFFLGYAYSEKDTKKQLGLSIGQWWYIGFWVFIALGVLAKGPVAIVLPGVTVIAFLLYVGRFREVVKEMPWVLGMGSFLVIAVPWFILVTLDHGQEYINTFFGLHNVQRFTSVVSRHPGAWYYYFPVVIVGFLPWSIYLPLAIARLQFWKRRLWCRASRSTHLGLFALVWLTVVFVFFSSSVTKLAGYILPLIPAAAIIVTLFWSDQSQQIEIKNDPSKRIWSILFILSGLANIAILAGLGVASFLSPQLIGNDPMMPQFVELLQGSKLVIKGGIIWSSAALGALILLFWKRHRRWIWVANLVGFIAFFSWVGLPVADIVDNQRQLPLRELSSLVKQERKPGERLVFFGFMRPTVVYYTQDIVDSITESDIDNGQAIDYFKQQSHTPETPSTVLIMTKPRYLEKLGLEPSDYQLIREKGAYQLIRIAKKRVVEKAG